MADEKQAQGGLTRETIYLVASCLLLYMLSTFLRNSVGVIAPDISRELDLNATELSRLVSFFFLSFALCQIPVGVLIDVFGPRRIILGSLCIMLVGCLIFATGTGYLQLGLARLLIGIGCSSFLMAPLAVYAHRFSPDRFSTMIGIQMGGGMIGMLVATAPLASVAATYGWRSVFWATAVAGLVVLVAIAVSMKDEAPASAPQKANPFKLLASSVTGLKHVIRMPGFAPVMAMQVITVGPSSVILGLWGGPWLHDIYGMELVERGNTLLANGILAALGTFLWGMSDRYFQSYRRPILIGSSITCVFLVVLATTKIPRDFLPVFLAGLGLFGAFGPLVFAYSRSLFPREYVARGLTLMNTAQIGGVFIHQAMTGYLIDLYEPAMTSNGPQYPLQAYQLVFGLLAVEAAFAFLFYWRAREVYPRR
jgi:MFS family permease